jgi:hypothetical protein
MSAMERTATAPPEWPHPEGWSPAPTPQPSQRWIVAVVAAVVLIVCLAVVAWRVGAFAGWEWDEHFAIAVHNDTATPVRIMEPCGTCNPRRLDLLRRLEPGQSVSLDFSNASSWTYVVEGDDGSVLGCLPFAFTRTPPKAQRTTEVSYRQPCPGTGLSALH